MLIVINNNASALCLSKKLINRLRANASYLPLCLETKHVVEQFLHLFIC